MKLEAWPSVLEQVLRAVVLMLARRLAEVWWKSSSIVRASRGSEV